MSSRPGADPADRFQLVDHLASGGMADVFLALESGAAGFSRLVVLKRLRAHLAGDEMMVDMFLREARLVARLDHPNIVKVHELGEISDAWYLSLEYVPGVTLRELMREATRDNVLVPFDVVVQILTQACAGAHAAHELRDSEGRAIGMVHRDISPDNLMITAEGHLKLLDFGIAKVPEDGDITRAGTLKGKLNYMSPEQAQQETVDRRSDVWSLGVVLWEALTTKRLFRRETEFASMHAVITGKLLEMDDFRKDIPRGLRDVALKALSLSPADRFPTADAMRRALEDAAFAAGIRPSQDATAAFTLALQGAELSNRAQRIRDRVERVKRGEELPLAPGATPSFSSIERAHLRSGPDPSSSLSGPLRPSRAPAPRASLSEEPLSRSPGVRASFSPESGSEPSGRAPQSRASIAELDLGEAEDRPIATLLPDPVEPPRPAPPVAAARPGISGNNPGISPTAHPLLHSAARVRPSPERPAERPIARPVDPPQPDPRPTRGWTPWIVGTVLVALVGAGSVGMLGAGAAAAWMYQEVPTGEPIRVGLPTVMDATPYLAAHEPIRLALQTALSRPVELTLTASYDALGEALIAGNVHYAILPPTLYLKTREKDPRVRALAIKLVDGVSGSDAVLLTRDGVALASVSELAGRTVCYTDLSSTSGYILPRAALRTAGINPDKDLAGSHFSGNHLQAMRDLAAGLCDAAGTYSSGWLAASREGPELAGLRVLAITGRAPQDAWVAGPAAPIEEVAAVRSALLSWKPTEDPGEAVERITGFAAPDEAAYARLREALIVEGALPAPEVEAVVVPKKKGNR